MKKATHQKTRQHNATLVLQTIYHHQRISRAEIARTTGLTRTTVSELVAELMAPGLVAETGTGPAAVGKPPIFVEVAAASRQLICLDLSEEELRGAVVDLRGEVRHRHALPLEARKGEGALEQVHRLVEALLALADAPVLGLGIGAPGPVDPLRGVIQQSVNRDWVNLNLKDILAARYGLPVHIANDCHVAALAECAYGGHGRTPSLVLIKVGEGIGSGIVLAGALHAGEGFSAGEIGHLSVDRQGLPCSCGNRGCLETVASAPALLRQAEALARCEPDTPFARAVAAGASLDLLRQLNAAGDPQARALVRALGASLGIAAASLAGILNIRRIVLSGSPAGFGEPLLEALRAELRTRVLPEQARQTCVGYTTQGADIVLRGACALVLRRELDLP